MVVKILLEHSGDLKWIAVMLGSGAEVREHLAHGNARIAEPSIVVPVIEIVAPHEPSTMPGPELPPDGFPGDDSDDDSKSSD
jgi:hypothetical protein